MHEAHYFLNYTKKLSLMLCDCHDNEKRASSAQLSGCSKCVVTSDHLTKVLFLFLVILFRRKLSMIKFTKVLLDVRI